MKEALERVLWERMATGTKAREVIDGMVDVGILTSAKPAHRTLEKWARAGLYEYGVSLDLGWLVEGATFPRLHEVKS